MTYLLAATALLLPALVGYHVWPMAHFHYGGGWSVGRPRCFILLRQWLIGVRLGTHWLRMGRIDVVVYPGSGRTPGWRIWLDKDTPLGARSPWVEAREHSEECDATAT